MIYAEATPQSIGAHLAGTYDLDARAQGALSLLLMRYRVIGPLEFDDKRLASVSRVTVRVWQNRVWPALQAIFTPGDDGLIHHAGMDHAAMERAAADGGESKRSAAASKAATARWDNWKRARQGDLLKDGNGSAQTADASPTHMRTHNQNPANSTVGASTSDSVGVSDAAGAAPRSRAHPPSPKEDSSLSSLPDSPLENPESLGEGERARASAAQAASRPASQPASAPASAPAHTTPQRHGRPEAVPGTPLALDWRPSPDGECEAAKWGYDAAELAADMRAHCVAHGVTRSNWDAYFVWWAREEAKRDGKRRQGHLMVPITGGRAPESAAPDATADEPDDPAAAIGNSPEAQWHRVRRTIKREVGAVEFRTWMRAATLLSIVGEEATVVLPTNFLRDWVRSHYADRLLALWQAENPAIRRLEIAVAPKLPKVGTG